MDLVIDANILIAAIVSSEGKTAEMLFSDRLTLLAPEFLLEEVKKHREEISSKSGLSEADFRLACTFFSSQIRYFPFSEFGMFIPQAKHICPDPYDITYIALALKFNCPIWSNDKILQQQREVKILTTLGLLKLLI